VEAGILNGDSGLGGKAREAVAIRSSKRAIGLVPIEPDYTDELVPVEQGLGHNGQHAQLLYKIWVGVG